ncbi:hypothetical protein [Streptomyces vilmorinianum]|uniref:hypothetical protein n=1 Tax=Streptomyces vilmorinianum TaxID=3051092 RepID=UPI0010FB9CAB|nr:hypothetical protein [Streptomyces vilmorinianum]
MRHTRTARLAAASLTAALSVGLLAGCGPDDGSGDGAPGPGRPTRSAPTPSATSTPTPTPTPTPSRRPDTAAALTCDQLRNAAVQTAVVKLPDYPLDSMRLTDGHWEGEDGVQVDLQTPCAIGHIVGDRAADAVGVVKVTPQGTGRFSTLVVWRNHHGTPVPFATESLGDRNPVVSVTVTGPAVTVVYRTRRDTEPPAVVTLTRTAVYRVAGAGLYEVSHVDTPYAGG